MVKIFESKVKEFEDEDGSVLKEKVMVFEFDDSEEDEDFELLSHNEQLQLLGLKECSTPNKEHGTVNRYYIDNSDGFLVVRENIISW